ncbi:MAG: FliH/SctL family protein [Ignavibacteriaceae bacterium]
MSDIIKLNVKSKKINVTLRNKSGSDQIKQESSEGFLQSQFLQYYEKGFDEGQKSVAAQLEKDFFEKLNKKYQDLGNIIAEFDRLADEYGQSFEKLVMNLSLVIAEKIIKREISQDSSIENVLSDAIKRVIGSNKILVKLNPTDLRNLNEESKNLISGESYSKINFEPDERIEAGGCLIETEIGNVDARISNQLSELKKQLESIFIPGNS